MDPQSLSLSSPVSCSRCRSEFRDDAVYVTWFAVDERTICPGCLTLLETYDGAACG